MVIDFHTHCFPDAIAQKAIPRLEAASGLMPYTDGTLAGLRGAMKRGGVDLSVVLSIATNAGQQSKVNDFAATLNQNEDIVAFGSVFPDSDDALDELERIAERGLKGVKLHPDYQRFFVDDEKYKPLYRKISELGLITVFHAGWDHGFAPPYGGTPERLAKALDWFSSPVVAAHWGGIYCNEGVLKHLCGRDVYFDVSFGYSMMPRYFAEKILEKHGFDKLLFGTDSPWHTAEMENRFLDVLGVTGEDREKINCQNAKKLLQL